MLTYNSLKISVKSTDGTKFEKTVSFKKGLNIISGENSSGKSLCLDGLLYGLGCEVIINRKKGAEALKPALSREIEDKEGKIYRIKESYVILIIENVDKKKISIKRWIKHPSIKSDLVRVYDNDILEKPSDDYQSYYVRRPNAATNNYGFHRYLTKSFLKWKMPKVANYNGTTQKLYIEQVLPLMFIEQLKGWVSIGNNIYNWRAKNILSRSIEFLLNLDTIEKEEVLSDLKSKLSDLKERWIGRSFELDNLADKIGGLIDPTPKLKHKKKSRPIIYILENQNRRISLDNYIGKIQEEYKKTANEVKISSKSKNEKKDNELQQKLTQLNDRKIYLEINLRNLNNSYYNNQELLKRLNKQRKRLTRDIQDFSDLSIIMSLGEEDMLEQPFDKCPICQTPLKDSAVESFQHGRTKILDIKDNKQYTEEEKKSVDFLLLHTEKRLKELKGLKKNYEEQNDLILEQIRDIKRDITTNQTKIDSAALRKEIRLQEKLRTLQNVRDSFDRSVENLHEISAKYHNVEKKIADLDTDLSHDDNQKIKFLEDKYIENLEDFGFNSSATIEIEISPDTFLPVFERFISDHEYSATDLIRKIWAYYLALLELSTKYNTNHFMSCVFDEPGQQQMKTECINSFYQRVLSMEKEKMQVIVATSAPLETIEQYIKKSANLIHISKNNKFLERINEK